jgi:6-phosphogluconolactonase (cycloisomerase 2 family)
MLRIFCKPAALAAGLAVFCANAEAHEIDAGSGVVYLSSNAASGNAVLVYRRDAKGGLTPVTSVPTGGNGTGAALGNQGAIALGDDDSYLAVVNAGGNSFTLFRTNGTRLTSLGVTPSGGNTPVSVAVHGDLIYVLNQASDQITGFRIGRNETVTPILGSSRLLSGIGVAAAEVAISPDGRYIVVTEKATSKIDVFGLDDNGLPSATPNTIASGGPTPYGFSFRGNHTVIVSQATGPAPGSSVESYHLGKGGSLTAVNGPVSTGENAACWIGVSPSGGFAYASDAASGFISAFEIGGGGALKLLPNSSISTGAGTKPLDQAFGGEGRYLYVLDGEGNGVLSFAVGVDGALKALGTPVTGLPAGATGLAAR